nr:U32 family peptidase C-terminal domain-containing protein [Clostridia bacterium]
WSAASVVYKLPAYALGENEKTVNYADSQAKGDCDYIANVISGGNGFLVAEMRGRFKVGDTLEVLSPSDSFGKSFKVEKAFTSAGEIVEDCKLVQEHYKINCPFELKSGDILRRRK